MYSIDDGFGFNEMRGDESGRRENARRERRRKETVVVGVSFSLESKDNFLGRTDERVGFVSSAERDKGVEKFVRTKEHDRGVFDSLTEAENYRFVRRRDGFVVREVDVSRIDGRVGRAF